MWEAHRTFPFIRHLLKKQFPGAEIIPYNELPNAYNADIETLQETVREKNCDVAIIGNAA
jgi:hypothetical protein